MRLQFSKVIFFGLVGLTTVLKAEPVAIPTNTIGGIGSGSTAIGGTFSHEGIPGAGFFVGHPNELPRNDRVVFAFPLADWLKLPAKSVKAKLTFQADYYFGGAPELDAVLESVRVETADGTVDESMLSDENSSTISKFKISESNQTKGGQVEAAPIEVDVTEAVQEALANGSSHVVFRLACPVIESEGNPNREAIGFSLDVRPVALPTLSAE